MSPREPQSENAAGNEEEVSAQANDSVPASEQAAEGNDAPSGEEKRAENNRTRGAQRDYSARYERPGKRRPADERAGAFNTVAWLVDGATGLVEELRRSDLGLSEEFWVHLYAARRESLLAARAAIDSLLEKSEQAEQAAQEKEDRQSRRGSVSVDF